ncbi:MAG: alpha/beta fold hydrolase [Phototrophicaceae bacterium]|jgi:pimeloyl-ACP methyl ester carboxylesterase
MSAIQVNGDLVHYEVLGRGRPIILIHGWLGSWRYWIPTVQQLHLKYRVYALDLFGFGDSGKNPSRYNIEDYVLLLDEFMDQLALPKAAIIGHGLGAMVAAEFAFRNQKRRVPRMMLVSMPLFDIGNLASRVPKRISRLVGEGESTPNGDNKPDYLEATIPSAGMMRAALLERMAARNPEAARVAAASLDDPDQITDYNYLLESVGTPRLASMLERCFKRSEIEFEKLHADVLATDDLILKNTIQNFDAAKILDTVQQLQMPTVLVNGMEDPLTPAPNEAVWDYLTNGKEDRMIPIPLPGVRHFPMLEHERFGSFIVNFLETADLSTLEVKERWRRRSR